jgi:predicted AAA+ superfamily ATPase
MDVQRKLISKINTLNKSILLLGPRQTGKSTFIQSLEPQLEIDLADQETFLKHTSDPGLIKQTTQPYKTIFVDEVQRIPSLLHSIQSSAWQNDQ